MLNKKRQKELEGFLSQITGATHMAEYEADSFKVVIMIGPASLPPHVYRELEEQQATGKESDPKEGRLLKF